MGSEAVVGRREEKGRDVEGAGWIDLVKGGTRWRSGKGSVRDIPGWAPG